MAAFREMACVLFVVQTEFIMLVCGSMLQHAATHPHNKFSLHNKTAHTPFHDMLPHLHTIYNDVVLLNVLTEFYVYGSVHRKYIL